MTKFYLLILVVSLLIKYPLFGQSFRDDEIAGFMTSSDYTGAANAAQRKLNHLSSKDIQKKTYYLNQLGFAYFRLGNFDSAYLCGIQVLHSSIKPIDSFLIADNWKLMAYVYNRKGRFDSALYYSQRMLGYAERTNNYMLKGNALTSIATILMQNKRYREALKYNTEAHTLYQKSFDSTSLISSEYNIGLAYLNLKIADSSLIFLFRSLKSNDKKHNKDIEAYIFDAIAECYYLKGETGLWKEYIMKSKEAAEKSGNPHFVAIKLSQQGQQYLIEGDLIKASEFLLNAHQTLTRQPYPALQMRVDSMLYIIARKQGRYSEALRWLESYNTLKNQVLNSRQAEELNNLILKIETHEKNLKLMAKEIEMRQLRQRLTSTISGIIILLLLIAGMIIYVYKIQRYRKTLYNKNIELDKQLRLTANLMDFSAILHPEIPDPTSERELPTDSEQPGKKLELYRNLLFLIESQKLYLDPEINVKLTQTRLGTNKKYLYEAIAEFSGTNFRGLINRFRVNEVRRKFEEAVANNHSFSVNEIAFSSGFNSYASFYRVFRQHTGLTPNEYLAQLKKGIPPRKN